MGIKSRRSGWTGWFCSNIYNSVSRTVGTGMHLFDDFFSPVSTSFIVNFPTYPWLQKEVDFHLVDGILPTKDIRPLFMTLKPAESLLYAAILLLSSWRQPKQISTWRAALLTPWAWMGRACLVVAKPTIFACHIKINRLMRSLDRPVYVRLKGLF